MPAEIHRWAEDDDGRGTHSCEVTVARGPLVMMAYGLLSIESARRGQCWITSPLGELDAADAAEALRSWSTAH